MLRTCPAQSRRLLWTWELSWMPSPLATYVQMDQTPVVAKSLYEGVEIMDMASALEKYDFLQDYWWKLVAPDADKYTADVAEAPPAGYFIRAKKGMKTVFPVKSCLYLGSTNLNQRVHNVIIAEEGSELHVINRLHHTRSCAEGAAHRRIRVFHPEGCQSELHHGS